MSKAAPKSPGTTEFPTFDATPAADQFRAFAEKGVEQSKEFYSRFKSGAEASQKALETSYESARAVSSDLSLKSIAAMRASSELTFSHFEALLGVKSVSDFIDLQQTYARRHYELAVNQVKDLQAASSKGAEDVSKPMKDIVEKTWTDLKVA